MKLNLHSLVAAGVGLVLTTTSAQSQTASTIPHLEKQGTATQLVVDGKPLHARGRVETNGTMLFLSSAIGVSRDYGSSAMPGYDIKLTPDSPVGGAFRLRVAANKKE